MEQAVKQRLVGVAVLAAFAAMLLPVVFDAERPPGVQVPEVIPPAPAYPAVVTPEPSPVALPADRPTAEPTPVDNMYQMANDEQAEAVPSAQTSAAVQTAAPTQKNKSPEAGAATAELPPLPAAPGGKLDASGIPEAWVVQVAAMADRKKADSLVAELKLKGYPAFMHVTRDAKGDTTRVLVGPKLDKAQALKLKQKLDREMGAPTMLKAFKPK